MYCNKQNLKSILLQYLLQNLKSITMRIAKIQRIAMSIEKSQSIAIFCNTTGTTPVMDGINSAIKLLPQLLLS